MVDVDAALAVIAKKAEAVAPRRAGVLEGWQSGEGWGGIGAWGAVLAETIRMGEESPRFDRAVVDGFALRSANGNAHAELKVVGRVDAGAPFGGSVGPGECVAINTGGVLPAGADAVLMVEHSEKMHKEGGEWMRVMRAVGAESGVHWRGSEAAAGSVVLEPGVRLGAGQIGACAAAGVGSVLVRRVLAGVITTGDELVDPAAGGSGLGEGKIWNSNRPMVCGLVREAGGVAVDLGNCPDDAGEMERRLAAGLEQCDLLIVCGGMSMGTKDLAPGLLRGLGVEMHIEKVKMKPGKPFLFGTVVRGGVTKYVAGLPGNPVSAFVTFHRFVRELMDRMTGAERPGARLVVAQMAGELPAGGDRDFYQPCRLMQRGAVVVAEILSWKGSGNMVMLGRTQGLLIQRAGAAAVRAGEDVRVLVTGGT